MIVYVLFHETNTGSSDDSDGYIEGIYATEQLAERAKLATIRCAITDGRNVYWNPDTEEEGPADWTDDWRVEAHQVVDQPTSTMRRQTDMYVIKSEGGMYWAGRDGWTNSQHLAVRLPDKLTVPTMRLIVGDQDARYVKLKAKGLGILDRIDPEPDYQ